MKRMAFYIFLVWFLAGGSFAEAGLPKEKIIDLFREANESFRKANIQTDDAERGRLYEQAILGYEKIINDGPVKNAGLYYNLANAYLLKQDIGRAILNYKKAERLDSSSADIRKNLAFAEGRRLDQVVEKTQGHILKTLFFWHYDFSIKTRFILTIILFALNCAVITLTIWFGRNAAFTSLIVIFGILLACFLCSVIWETGFQPAGIRGVITAGEIMARQGDAASYPPSFKDPLHSGTEFILIEKRTGWLHIKLSDNSDGWIPETSAEII